MESSREQGHGHDRGRYSTYSAPIWRQIQRKRRDRLERRGQQTSSVSKSKLLRFQHFRFSRKNKSGLWTISTMNSGPIYNGFNKSQLNHDYKQYIPLDVMYIHSSSESQDYFMA